MCCTCRRRRRLHGTHTHRYLRRIARPQQRRQCCPRVDDSRSTARLLVRTPRHSTPPARRWPCSRLQAREGRVGRRACRTRTRPSQCRTCRGPSTARRQWLRGTSAGRRPCRRSRSHLRRHSRIGPSRGCICRGLSTRGRLRPSRTPARSTRRRPVVHRICRRLWLHCTPRGRRSRRDTNTAGRRRCRGCRRSSCTRGPRSSRRCTRTAQFDHCTRHTEDCSPWHTRVPHNHSR